MIPSISGKVYGRMGCQEDILVALYEGPCAKEGTMVNTKEGYAKGGGQGALVEQYMCGARVKTTHQKLATNSDT